MSIYNSNKLRIERKFLYPVTSNAFINHSLIAGLSGSGKSNAAEFRLTQKVGKIKVFDVYDSGRFENMLYNFPENDPMKIREMIQLSNGLIRPKATKNEIIAICGRNLPHHRFLPGNNKDIGFFLQSFRENELTIGDLATILGETSAMGASLDYVAFVLGTDKISFADILKALKHPKIKRGLAVAIIGSLNRKITRMKNSGMFSPKVDRIDIYKSAMKKDVITSFSTFLLNMKEEPTAYFMIIKTIFELKRQRKIPHRILVYWREGANLFNKKGYEEVRNYLLSIQREGRDIGLDILIDTQMPKDLPPAYRTQFGYKTLMKADMKVAETLLETQDIPKAMMNKVPKFDLGHGIVLTGQRWDQPVVSPPAQHRHKVPGMKVLQMLKNMFGEVEYKPEEILPKDEGETDIDKVLEELAVPTSSSKKKGSGFL